MMMRRSVQLPIRGATILEAVFAGALMALFMGGLFEMNGRNLQMLKSGKESFAATVVLEERLEQLRSGKWSDITSPGYLSNILSNPPSSTNGLHSLRETIVVSAYPAATPAAVSNSVSRSATGVVSTASSNPDLATGSLVRADLRVTWSGTPRGRTRTRELSTVIADGGLITR